MRMPDLPCSVLNMAKPIDEKDLLQAVVIADSFNYRFAPVTSHYPRALLPLGNVPLIDYALKALADAGVHECIVYCRSHADAVAKWIQEKDGSSQSARFPTRPIVRRCPGMRSLGDAMRDLDQSRLVKNDFILLPADLVTNVDLAEVLAEHKRRRVKDVNCLMTLVMRSTSGGPEASGLMLAQERCGVAVTNAATGCLRHLSYTDPVEAKVRIDGAALRSCMHSRLWTGLVDCGLAVCSVHVPPRFSDEFDYRSLDDLVRGVLVNEEILGHTVSLRVLGSREYASRVSNMHMYAMATAHLLDNWIFPVTPACMASSIADYQLRPRNVYVSRMAKVHRSARLIKSVLIDRNAEVGSGCVLKNCVIGFGCRIGNDCTLSDCYLWPGAIIESGCEVRQSLLCNDCHVLDGTILSDRCVLAPGVRVGPSAELADCRLVKAEDDVSYGAGGSGGCGNDAKNTLGAKSNAVFHRSVTGGKCTATSAGDEDEDEDDGSGSEDEDGGAFDQADADTAVDQDEDVTIMWQLPGYAAAAGGAQQQRGLRPSENESTTTDDDAPEVPLPAVGEDHFARELLDVLIRAEKDSQSSGTMIVEINSIKHAFCVHIDRLKSILAHTILLYALLRREQSETVAGANTAPPVAAMTPMEYYSRTEERLKAWRPVLGNYFNDAESPLLFLRSFEDACCERPQPLMKCAVKLLKYFYDTDLCDEPAILRWHAEEGAHSKAKEVRDSVRPMINWLQQASEESDDSD